MGIKVEHPEQMPALVFDKIHLHELSITQPYFTDNNKQPEYNLSIAYKLFALDDENVRHYTKKPVYINIQDYLAEAYKLAVQGDMRLAQAMAAIEQALAVILEQQNRHGNTEIY